MACEGRLFLCEVGHLCTHSEGGKSICQDESLMRKRGPRGNRQHLIPHPPALLQNTHNYFNVAYTVLVNGVFCLKKKKSKHRKLDFKTKPVFLDIRLNWVSDHKVTELTVGQPTAHDFILRSGLGVMRIATHKN